MTPVPCDFLGGFEPAEVFVYYDIPRIFTVAHEGLIYYVQQATEGDDGSSYLVRPADDGALAELWAGRTDLRAFILAGEALY